jgi:hypothetical protein
MVVVRAPMSALPELYACMAKNRKVLLGLTISAKSDPY